MARGALNVSSVIIRTKSHVTIAYTRSNDGALSNMFRTVFISLTEAGGHQVEEGGLGGLEHVHHADSGQQAGDVGWQGGG